MPILKHYDFHPLSVAAMDTVSLQNPVICVLCNVFDLFLSHNMIQTLGQRSGQEIRCLPEEYWHTLVLERINFRIFDSRTVHGKLSLNK